MASGKVKCFDEAKGYGFISRENEKDLFVHKSNVLVNSSQILVEGQTVSFSVVKANGKSKAINVKVTAQPPVKYVNPFTATYDPPFNPSASDRSPSAHNSFSDRGSRAGLKFRFIG